MHERGSTHVWLQSTLQSRVGEESLANFAVVLLASVLEQTVSGVHIMRIEPMGSVNLLGVDPKYRPLVSVNFRCLVRM